MPDVVALQPESVPPLSVRVALAGFMPSDGAGSLKLALTVIVAPLGMLPDG